MSALSFYRMKTDEISERYIASCFVNGVEAFDEEVNLAFDENLLSNEFTVKLCLDYEVKKRKKLVNKELIVALKGELYFIKFIINPEEDDFELGVILGRSFLRIANGIIDFEERPVIETMAYNDKYRKILNEIWKDKVELDGKTMKEDGEAVRRIKGKALKEKDDPGAFIFPIRLEGKVNENALADTRSNINTMPYRIFKTLGREDMKKIDRGITMINHTQTEAILQEHTTEKPDRLDPNAKVNTKQWRKCCFHKFIMSSCYGKDVTEMLSLEINDMLRIRVREVESKEEIFTALTLIRALNINEPIYAELCYEFYSTYKFDEMCADDELQSKKIIKFRLGGRAHSLTLSEFARRLGLYQALELEDDDFNVYFEGGLRSDDNLNAADYWLNISHEENLSLSRSHTSTIKRPILRVIHKMITYGLCQRTAGYDKVQKNDLWLLSMFDARHQNGYANVAWFISKLARKCRVLTEDVVRSLSAPIYCKDLDTTTFRDLFDCDGKLIIEDPHPGVPRVGIPRPPRASMQDFYDKMGRMKIQQEAIEHMKYRQSYHWDRYHRVFEHMAGVYSVSLQGAYNPPSYAQLQYDQYYQ
nr:hypothetical protein [Tanacetum cinerariifolium]